MTESMNRAQGEALAKLIRTVRPEWDEGATYRAIGRLRDRGALAWVAYRCLLAAADPDCRTPAGLELGEYWPSVVADGAPTPVPERYVPEHRPHPGADVAAHYLAQMRAELAHRPKEQP